MEFHVPSIIENQSDYYGLKVTLKKVCDRENTAALSILASARRTLGARLLLS